MSLARSDSMSSMGSAHSGASGASSAQSMAGQDGGAGGPQEMLEQSQQVQTAIFGTMYSILRVRWESVRRYVLLRFFMEHLQLLLVLLQPTLGWSTRIMRYNLWPWQVANYVLLKSLVVPAGWTAYIAVLYGLLALVGVCVGACVWVGYIFIKYNLAPNKWPVKLLRLVLVVLFHVFYVTLLNYALAPVSCQFLATAAAGKGTMVDFPTQKCFAMPAAIHVAVGAAIALLVAAAGALFAFADVTNDLKSRMWMANAHAAVELKGWALRTLIVLSSNLLIGNPQAQSLINLVAAGWLAYVYLRWEPYYYAWTNHLRVGCYAATAFVALMNAIMVWPDSRDNHRRAWLITLLALTILPAALLIGIGLSWLRLRLSVNRALHAFRMADLTTTPLRNVWRFQDAWELELAARCCRAWVPFEDALLVPEKVALADTIIKAGMQRFDKCPFMALTYVGFLMDIQDNPQSGHSQLQAARKLEPSLLQRYVLFVREQQHMAALQVSTGGGLESGVDLVGYVEFQRNYKQALRAHKAALFAQRSFWKQLLHNSVTFRSLVKSFGHIESCRQRADHTYKMVLERYPKNIKVLRAYARFVEDVKSDPWTASHIYGEADKLEETELHTDTVDPILGGTEGGAGGGAGMTVDEKSSAVVIINSSGIIQMANKVALKLFGYKKAELEGKNVSILMPNPFSSRHNTYLRNYLTTGQGKILDAMRQLVAMHKDRYVFPVNATVTKVSGSGADAIFMGVLKPSPDDGGVVKAWVMPGGMVLCVDQRFTDWLGKTPTDCTGKPLASLAVDVDKTHALVELANTAPAEDFAAGLLRLEGVSMHHKYADPIKVDLVLEMGGTDSQRLFVVNMRKAEGGGDHLMVVDGKGRVQYATSHLADLLGTTPKAMVKQEFCKFMAQPFQQLHTRWMKNATSRVPLCSCRNGAPVVLVNANGQGTPCKLQISSMDRADETVHVVRVKPCTFPDALRDRRVSLHIDNRGNITSVSDSPPLVFGFRPASLVGRNLSHVVDVFEGLPETGGVYGMDMQQLLMACVHRTLEHKDSSWRVGVHPPLSPEELASALSNSIQANMLANQTKAGVMQFEVVEADEDSGLASCMVHLWRAEMLTGVLELDREAVVQKAGCCALHQPGILFGMPSAAMLQTPLAHWLNVPPTWDTLLLNPHKKQKGALKRRAADVKIGPLMHVEGMHNDGSPVAMTAQAVVKEGNPPPRLVVKLTIEKPRKGDQTLLARILGKAGPLPAAGTAGGLAAVEGLHPMHLGAPGQLGSLGGAKPAPRASQAGAPAKAKGGVKFERASGDSDEPPARSRGGARDEGPGPMDGEGPGDMDDWMPPPPEEDPSQMDLLPPADSNMPDEAASVGSAGDVPGEAGESAGDDALYQSDFKRGKRLRKLARLLASKRATKAGARFKQHTVLLALGLIVAHLACFVASVVLIDNQRQYINEVDDAGNAVITMHQIATSCVVMDALYKGQEQAGIFVRADMQTYADAMKVAADKFEGFHDATYFGAGSLRRLSNTNKYPLQDYWEAPMWNVTQLQDTHPPKVVSEAYGLFEIGTNIIAAAREVYSNHERIVDSLGALSLSRHWQYIMDNLPHTVYSAYKLTLFGLVDRASAKIEEVGRAMLVLLVLEGCCMYMLASLYVTFLMRQMTQQRHNLFSVFLVIPTGFLRALASKQVQLDEDEDSDTDSEAGDVANVPDQQQESGATKLALSLPGKKGKKGAGDKEGAGQGGLKRRKQSLGQRLLGALNPTTWFGAVQSIDTGKKQLVANSSDTLRMSCPFLLWGCLLAVIYGITFKQLSGIDGPFQQLNMINFLVFRVIRNILFALQLCLSPDALKAAGRTALHERLADTITDYNTFLYGVTTGGGDSSLLQGHAALFESKGLAEIFFRTTDCLRADKSTCFPVTHKYHDVTHHGLDAVAVRFIQEAQLLMADANPTLTLNSTRLEYIWQVGNADLFDGMKTADENFRETVFGVLNQLKLVHIVIFLLSLGGCLFFLLALVRPFLRRTSKETRQIAEMLSQLPNDMDLEALVGQALAADDDEDDEDDLFMHKGNKGGEAGMMQQQQWQMGMGMAPGGLMAGEYAAGGWMGAGGPPGAGGGEEEEEEDQEPGRGGRPAGDGASSDAASSAMS